MPFFVFRNLNSFLPVSCTTYTLPLLLLLLLQFKSIKLGLNIFLCKHIRLYTGSRVHLNPSEALIRNKRFGSFRTRNAVNAQVTQRERWRLPT